MQVLMRGHPRNNQKLLQVEFFQVSDTVKWCKIPTFRKAMLPQS